MDNKNNKTVIIDNQYLPCLIYFKILSKDTNVKIEQCEYFEKMSFRNRCFLAGPNGLLSLSVPVENGRNQRTIVRDVKISYRENWPLIHWRSLHDAYRKAPFFEWYMDDIKALFETRPVYLFDWNLKWLEWLIKQSGLSIQPGFTEQYQLTYASGELDLRSAITPKNYLQYKGLPVYTQVFSHRQPFMPNLSFLDLLLCEGKRAGQILVDSSG